MSGRVALQLAAFAAASHLLASHELTRSLFAPIVHSFLFQLITVYFSVVMLLVAHPRRGKQPLLDVARFFLVLPLYTLIIWIDASVIPSGKWNPFLLFPRDRDEILRRPARFFNLLKHSEHGSLPGDAELIDIVPHGSVEAEPDKNATICKLLISYRSNQKVAYLPVFVKYQTSRMSPPWIKGLISAFSEWHNEREFYASGLASTMPMPVPQYLGGWYSRTFHRVMTATALIDSNRVTVPDHIGATQTQMHAMLKTMSSMHAKFWRRNVPTPDNDPQGLNEKAHTIHLTARRGVEWLESMDLFVARHKAPWFAPLWNALRDWHRNYQNMTVSHGDCRPGNMLFDPKSKTDAPEKCAPLLFADWEAVSFTPYLWDFTYCTTIGQSVEERRLHQEEYLQLYLSSLRACGVSESETRIEDARRDVKLMTLLLYQYSWMLMQAKQVGATQGNTQADMKKWGDRVHLSAWDATSDPESLAAELKIPVKLIDDFRLQERAEHIDAYVAEVAAQSQPTVKAPLTRRRGKAE